MFTKYPLVFVISGIALAAVAIGMVWFFAFKQTAPGPTPSPITQALPTETFTVTTPPVEPTTTFTQTSPPTVTYTPPPPTHTSTPPPPAPQPPPPPPQATSVTVEADDHGLYPASVSVPKGAAVNLTFAVRSTNVYYGGLDFRSSLFNTGKVPSGGSLTVYFTATATFTYASYWPASGVKKADGTIVVQ